MKHFYIGLLILVCGLSSALGQTTESIYSYQGDSIVAKSKYITPFYFEDQNTPSFLFKTFNVSSKDKAYSYTVKLSNYKGAENDGGYYRIIDIELGGKKLLSLKQSDGWDILRDKTLKSDPNNDYFFIVPLTNTSMALVFVGYPYQSQPELLTIAVLNKDKAALVYNKEIIINNIEYNSDSSFTMNLQDFPMEYLSDRTPAYPVKLFKIFQTGDILKFGGPYGTKTK